MLCLASRAPGQGSAWRVHPEPVSAEQAAQKAYCLKCHANTSGPVIHEPITKEGCIACHKFETRGKETMVAFILPGEELCLKCHKEQNPAGRKHPHPPALDSCNTCHNPHASTAPKLLREPQADVCQLCHERSKGVKQHGPYGEGKCSQCHDPHGSNRDLYLRADVNSLCEGCHKVTEDFAPKIDEVKKTVALPYNVSLTLQEYDKAPKIGLDRGGERGHPLMRHPFSGRNLHENDASVTCLSCHQSHASALPKLLPAGMESAADLCERCHRR